VHASRSSATRAFRLVVAYGAVARLGLTAQRNEPAALDTWRHTTDTLLDKLQ
jgi:hypothetical protein